MYSLMGVIIAILGAIFVIFSFMLRNNVFSGAAKLIFGNLCLRLGFFSERIGLSMSGVDIQLYTGLLLLAIGLIFIFAAKRKHRR